MLQSAHNRQFTSTTSVMAQRLAVWNRRLLIAAAVFVLLAASILALHASGPDARAMLAGEGMLVVPASR